MKLKIFLVIIILILLLSGSIYFIYKQENTIEEQEEWKREEFDLRSKIKYESEYQIQATYKSCWAYAGLDCIETNLMLKQGLEYDFSEIAVEYLTSDLLGGTRVFESGNSVYDTFYITGSYKGAVLESEIPNRKYEKSEYHLLLNAKPIVRWVKEISFFQFQDDFMERVKKHLVENGSISAGIYFDPNNDEVYNPETYAYYYPSENENHVGSIIGWDDNYAKENFKENNRPKKDGAFLVNCFWKQYGEDCIIYVPYEEAIFRRTMIGAVECQLY